MKNKKFSSLVIAILGLLFFTASQGLLLFADETSDVPYFIQKYQENRYKIATESYQAFSDYGIGGENVNVSVDNSLLSQGASVSQTGTDGSILSDDKTSYFVWRKSLAEKAISLANSTNGVDVETSKITNNLLPDGVFFEYTFKNGFGASPLGLSSTSTDSKKFAFFNTVSTDKYTPDDSTSSWRASQLSLLKELANTPYSELVSNGLLSSYMNRTLYGVSYYSDGKVSESTTVLSPRTPSFIFSLGKSTTDFYAYQISSLTSNPNDNLFQNNETQRVKTKSYYFSGTIIDEYRIKLSTTGIKVGSNKQKKGSKSSAQGTFMSDFKSAIKSIQVCNADANPNGYAYCHYRSGNISVNGDITGGVYFPDDYIASTSYISVYANNSESTKHYNILCDVGSANCNSYGMRRNSYTSVQNVAPTSYDAQYWKACSLTDTFWNETKGGFAYDFLTTWSVDTYTLDYQNESKKDNKITKRVVSNTGLTIKDYDASGTLIRTWTGSRSSQILNMPPVVASDKYTVGQKVPSTITLPNMISIKGQDYTLNCNTEYLKAYFISLLQESIKDTSMYSPQYRLTKLYSNPTETTSGAYNTGRRTVTDRDTLTENGKAYEQYMNYWAYKATVESDPRLQFSSVGVTRISNGHWYYNHFSQSNFAISNDMFISNFEVFDDNGNQLGTSLVRSLSAQTTNGFIGSYYSDSTGSVSTSVAPSTYDSFDSSDRLIDISSYIDAAYNKTSGDDSGVSMTYDPCTVTESTTSEVDADSTYTEFGLTVKATVEYISWYEGSSTVLLDGMLQTAKSTRTKSTDSEKNWSSGSSYSGNECVSVIFGNKSTSTIPSISKKMDTVGAFSDNGGAVRYTHNGSLSNLGVKTFQHTYKITESVAANLMKGKTYRLNVHVNLGHAAVGDDSVASNSYQYVYLVYGTAYNKTACVEKTEDATGAYIVKANDISQVVAKVNDDGTVDSSKLEAGEEYRLVLDISYTGGERIKYHAGYYKSYSSTSRTHNFDWGIVGYTTPTATLENPYPSAIPIYGWRSTHAGESYYRGVDLQTTDTYWEYGYAFNGTLTVSEYTGEDISTYFIDDTDISVGGVSFDNYLGLMTKNNPSKSLSEMFDASMSDGVVLENGLLVIRGEADGNRDFKYVSKPFTAETGRIVLDYKAENTSTGSPWDYDIDDPYEEVTEYSAAINNSWHCQNNPASTSRINNRKELGDYTGGVNGTVNSINNLVFINKNYVWDVAVKNFEVLPKVELPTEEKMVTLSVKYDIDYQVPDGYTLTKPQTMYVLLTAKCGDTISTKVEKISITSGLNTDIVQQIDFYIDSSMYGSNIEVSVLANVAPHNVSVSSNPEYKYADGSIVDTNMNKIYTLTGNGYYQRVFEYEYSKFECSSKLGLILQNNQAYGSVAIKQNTDLYEFCEPTVVNKITCNTASTEFWNQFIHMGSMAFSQKSFENIIQEARIIYNYSKLLMTSDSTETLEESFKITQVRFRSKMTEDLNYGDDDNWVIIYDEGDNSLNPEAVIKAGYGFEIEIDVEYDGPDYDNVGNTDTTVTRGEPVAANVWEEIYLKMPDSSTISMNGTLVGSNALMTLKSSQLLDGNKIKYTYTIGGVEEEIDDSGILSQSTEKEYKKIVIGESTKNGIYQIKIATPAIMGTLDKSSMWNYANGTVSNPTGNILCDSIIVKFTVTGTATDDINTHTGK